MPICADSVASDLPNVVFPLQARAIGAMRWLHVDKCVSRVVRMRRGDLSSSIPTFVFSVFGGVMLVLLVDAVRARCLCFRDTLLFLGVQLIQTCVSIAFKSPELKTCACAAFRILVIVDKVRDRFVLRAGSILGVPLAHISSLWLTVAGVMSSLHLG